MPHYFGVIKENLKNIIVFLIGKSSFTAAKSSSVLVAVSYFLRKPSNNSLMETAKLFVYKNVLTMQFKNKRVYNTSDHQEFQKPKFKILPTIKDTSDHQRYFRPSNTDTSPTVDDTSDRVRKKKLRRRPDALKPR